MKSLRLFGLIATLPLVACASSSTIPLAKNAVHIDTQAAPVCGSRGARKLALRQAAVETINRGYDSFIVAGAQATSTYVGTTPTQTYTTGSAAAYGGAGYANAYGSATSTTYGGVPVYAPGQGLTVRMFRTGEPGAQNAIDARSTLGPDWQKIASKRKLTCL